MVMSHLKLPASKLLSLLPNQHLQNYVKFWRPDKRYGIILKYYQFYLPIHSTHKKKSKFGLTEIEVFQSLVYSLTTYNWLSVALSRFSLSCVALCRSHNTKLLIATWSVNFAIFLVSSYDPC
jgi:hypothetical protein